MYPVLTSRVQMSALKKIEQKLYLSDSLPLTWYAIENCNKVPYFIGYIVAGAVINFKLSLGLFEILLLVFTPPPMCADMNNSLSSIGIVTHPVKR